MKLKFMPPPLLLHAPIQAILSSTRAPLQYPTTPIAKMAKLSPPGRNGECLLEWEDDGILYLLN